MLAASPQLRALQGATAQLDGERDPRCLLAAFANMAALARLYLHHSAASRQVFCTYADGFFSLFTSCIQKRLEEEVCLPVHGL